ncbi:hypothetical protein Gotur_013387 [Gossypium turneri]
MGALDSLSDYISDLVTVHGKRKKRKVMQTVEIKVKMDCDGCERRVKNAVSSMKGAILKLSLSLYNLPLLRGRISDTFLVLENWKKHKKAYICGSPRVKSVEVNRKKSYVSVSGYVEPNKVLKKVKSTGKRAEFWPYVPYNLVAYPYVAQAYDKKAPSGYVKEAVQALPSPNAVDEKFVTFFSDENPNACSIM